MAAVRTKNAFDRNDFTEMKLGDVDFRTGIDLTRQKMPVGPEYICLPTAIAREAVMAALARAVEPDRKHLDVLAKMLEWGSASGQEQFFLSLNAFGPGMREAMNAAFRQ